MTGERVDLILRGGRIVDPGRGVDLHGDVVVHDGRIVSCGPTECEVSADDEHDVSGLVVTPGLVDGHSHVFGGVGVSNPDAIGVAQGVTTIVDAGGVGPLTFCEFEALLPGHIATDVYAYASFFAPGFYSYTQGEGNPRDIYAFHVNEWLDIFEDTHRRALIVAQKGAGFGSWGIGPVRMAKGLAELLDLPFYCHIGEIMNDDAPVLTASVFDLMEPGDVIAHIYNGNRANILREDDSVLPEVLTARDRGVLFDAAFGSFNFSFAVAEIARAQGVDADIISPDLQLVNVTGPAFSLTHVMSLFLTLGMSLEDVVERATIAPARAFALDDRIGSLAPGRRADVTVLDVESGEYVFRDCDGRERTGGERLTPRLTVRAGRVYECDEHAALDERVWNLQVADEHVPERADDLSPNVRGALRHVNARLDEVDAWEGLVLHHAFHRATRECDVPLRDVLLGLQACFFDEPFTQQAGWLLAGLDPEFVQKRLTTVCG